MGSKFALMAAAVMALFLIGCGGGGDDESAPSEQDQVRQVINRFTALAANGDDGCQEYVASSGSLRGAIKAGESLSNTLGDDTVIAPCGFPEKTEASLATLVVSRVTIAGDTATVAFDGSSATARLVRENGEWRVQEFR